MDVESQRKNGGWELHSDRDTWCALPRWKISRDVLNPEIRGARSTLLGVPCAEHCTTSRRACTDSLYAWHAHLSPFTHPREQQARAHYTYQRHTRTRSPCHPPLFGFTRPQLQDFPWLHTLGGGGRDAKKEGQRPSPFLGDSSPPRFLPGQLNQSCNLCLIRDGWLGYVLRTLSWGARRGGPG